MHGARSVATGQWPGDNKFKMEGEAATSRKLVVLFGSQTGTAEEVAERIGREARRRYIIPIVIGMDDYEIVCGLLCTAYWYCSVEG